MKKISRFWKGIIAYTGILVMLHVAFLCSAVCDFYVDHIFCFWVNTYGRLTGCVPFSIGEGMIVVAILILLVAAGVGVASFFFWKRVGYRNIH